MTPEGGNGFNLFKFFKPLDGTRNKQTKNKIHAVIHRLAADLVSSTALDSIAYALCRLFSKLVTREACRIRSSASWRLSAVFWRVVAIVSSAPLASRCNCSQEKEEKNAWVHKM